MLEDDYCMSVNDDSISFGTKIKVRGSRTIQQYELGHRWKLEKDSGKWVQMNEIEDSRPPQILFIERCLQFLDEGGRMGIILPESIFGMPKYNFIIDWLMDHTEIVGMVSMPEELFQPYTHAKACVVFLRKTRSHKVYPIHMAIAEWCGHDSKGNDTILKSSDGTSTLLDDIPTIAERLKVMNIWE
ncbi:MAG: N-6 DNA methylase [Nitrososphaeraceae archaeon]